MSNYDLLNVIYVDVHPKLNMFTVHCRRCNWWTVAGDLNDANDVKIDHENRHGIYLDPDTGELYEDAKDAEL